MKNDNTRELVELSLYAALIIVTVQFIRIPFGPQFVHLGNALVVIAILIFGARKGAVYLYNTPYGWKLLLFITMSLLPVTNIGSWHVRVLRPLLYW